MTTPKNRFSYGDDKLNFADLHRAPGEAAHGTVVLIHGGFWRWNRTYFDGPTPLALDLAHRGFNVWQLEYRSMGRRGGWPATFVDIDAGIAQLAKTAEAEEFETGPIMTMGHSAGGHLAVWALGIEGSPLVGAISLAGVLDLRLAERDELGSRAVANFLGGRSSRHPDRYDGASPAEHPVPGKLVRLVHGTSDYVVPMSQSTSYLEAARAADQDATLAEFTGDHFDVIDPAHPSWKLSLAAANELAERGAQLAAESAEKDDA